jgi:excisionase family DNA binding protein
MASLSLREAAEQAGTSKSTIWRAIRGGRLSATRTDDGGFAIDPAELFGAFPPQQPKRQDATLPERPATPETNDLEAKRTAAETEIASLKALLEEVRSNRDELRQDRDEWRARVPLALPPPERAKRPWWRRLAG